MCTEAPIGSCRPSISRFNPTTRATRPCTLGFETSSTCSSSPLTALLQSRQHLARSFDRRADAGVDAARGHVDDAVAGRADSTSSGLTTSPRAERAETVPRSAVTTPMPVPASPSRRTRPRRRFSDDQFIAASRHVDLPGLLERADDAHDAVLRLFDGLELDRTEQLDLLGEACSRAL